ncbi:MAG: PepSY-associated TM helix domain-containing protein [Bacteroidota bacterium]
MKGSWHRRLKRLNIATHRDVGYFFSSLIIIYCLSGIALNHVNDWNPDFIIQKKTIEIHEKYSSKELTVEVINSLGKLVGENKFKVYDTPTSNRVKIYYENASLLIDFSDGVGIYEKVSRRPIFFQSNIVHRNSLKGWKWASDAFALMLIIISVTGLFILKGKKGISGRGKWLIAAGGLPPLLALILYEVL